MPDGDLTGQTIRGYELHEAIGAGGFGAVYRAYQAAVRREVAIKIILPQFASEPEFIRRFEAEAQIVARLEHPYIVPLYDYWRDPSGAYLVMRWLSGGSLRGLLRQERLSLDNVGKLLDQIGAALGLAHRRGVIHRDLKPDNVLLDDERNAYLADFGIAKDVHSPQETADGELIITGTPTYIAPEQVSGAPVTPRTDIYSLGIMLYELLTGNPPFAGLSLSELLQKHLYETLPPLIMHRPDLPHALNAVIQMATAKTPADRYPGAPEMAAAFRQAVGASSALQTGDSTVASAGTPRVPRSPPRPRRDTPRLANTPTITPDMPTITPADERAPLASPDMPTVTPDPALAVPVIQRPSRAEPTITPGEAQAILLQGEPDNPYKGLRAFEEADAADFFGRETLLEQLIARLAQREAGARFLAVVGPSGSGKSSAVKAGLIPALHSGALPGSDRWFVVEMTPGAAPFDELADALQRIATTSSADLGARLRHNSNGLLTAVNYALPADNRVELALVIDQFEELFTLPTDPSVCAQFLDILLTAVTTPDSRVRVIITLRADFYDRPLLYPGFGELVRKRTEVVLPLDTDGLRRAIALPAERAGLMLETGLIEEVLRDVAEQPAALPLLQYALTELFERREGRTLTLLAYRESGGVIGALARRADALYAGLIPDDQAAARQVFLRLVTPGEGVEDTRRRALRPELAIADEDDNRVDALLNRFGQYRLLTFDRDPTTRIPTIEIAHEALIRTWGRLRDWVAASRDDLLIQRRLSAAVAEWLIAGRDPGFLATEARLTQFESWASATALALSRDESDYLRISITEREARQARDDARKAQEAAIARRAQTFGRTAAVLGAVGVLAVIATIVAALQAANARAEVSYANEQLDIAAQTLTPVPATLTPVSLTLAAGGTQIAMAQVTGTFAANQIVSVQVAALSARALTDPSAGPETAILLAVHALRTAYSPEADAALTNALNNQFAIRQLSGHTDSVTSVAVSPDAHYVLSGSNDGTARLWDLQTGAQIRVLSGHSGHVLSVAFSPDGKTALTGGNDKTARLWNVSTGKELRELSVGAAVLAVAFSPDGAQILTGQDNKIAQVWGVQSGVSIHTLTGHKDAVFAVAFSPNGKLILTGSADQTARIWDAQAGTPIQPLSGHTDSVLAVAFSPDGKLIVTGSADQTARVWDTQTGTQKLQLGGPFTHTDVITSVAFSPDGQSILTASDDHTAKLWNTKSGSLIRTFIGHADSINSAAFSPDGRFIVTASLDKTLRVWATYNVPGELIGHTAGVNSVAFSPDSQLALTGSSDGTARLWDVHTDQEIRQFDAKQAVESAALSSDGRYVLTGDVAKAARLWDAHTGKPIRDFVGHTGQINAVAFSPDGKLVLSGSADHTARLWNTDTGAQVQIFTHSDWVTSAVFSPDGQSVLTGSYDGTVKLWNVQTGALLQTFGGSAGKVQSVAFSPDSGTVLAGGYNDFTVRLWDIHSGSLLRTFSGASLPITDVGFVFQGQAVVAGSADGVTRLWNGATGADIGRWLGTGGDVLGFSDDGTLVAFGQPDGVVRMRPVDYRAFADSACARVFRNPPMLTGAERKLFAIVDTQPICPATH